MLAPKEALAFRKSRADLLYEQQRRAGRLLGCGGEGGVVEAAFLGGRYALKESQGDTSGESMIQESGIRSPFVQVPLAITHEASNDNTYLLLSHAAGDLAGAWDAHLAATSKAAAGANGGCPALHFQPARTSGVVSATVTTAIGDPAAAAAHTTVGGAPLLQLKRPGWRGKLAAGRPIHSAAEAAAAAAGAHLPSIPEARPLMAEMAAGVSQVHAKGMFHGDVKPANFLVASGTGHTKLADFGLAGQCGQAPDGGTPDFAAPEVAAVAAPLGLWEALRGMVACAAELLLGPCLGGGGGGCGGGGGREGAAAGSEAPQSVGAGRDSCPGDVFALGASFAWLAAAPAERKPLFSALDAVRGGEPLLLPPSLLRDGRLARLLAWMLSGDASERPTMEEVRAHAFFEGVEWEEMELSGALGRPPLLAALDTGAAEREARAQAERSRKARAFARRAAAGAKEAAAKACAEVKGAWVDGKGAARRACAEMKAAFGRGKGKAGAATC